MNVDALARDAKILQLAAGTTSLVRLRMARAMIGRR